MHSMHTIFATNRTLPWTGTHEPFRASQYAVVAGAERAQSYGSYTVASASGAGRNMLHGPAVAVRVAEENELAPGEILHLADLHAALQQLSAGCVDI